MLRGIALRKCPYQKRIVGSSFQLLQPVRQEFTQFVRVVERRSGSAAACSFAVADGSGRTRRVQTSAVGFVSAHLRGEKPEAPREVALEMAANSPHLIVDLPIGKEVGTGAAVRLEMKPCVQRGTVRR